MSDDLATVPVAALRHVEDHGDTYDTLVIWCPGCAYGRDAGGLHMLPVTGDASKRPTWTWDGDLDAPTLSPSILTYASGEQPRCHSFLRAGVWEFLDDSTHALAGHRVPMVPLPGWALGGPS